MFEQTWKIIQYQPLQENELYKRHMIKRLAEAKICVVNLNAMYHKITLFVLLLIWCSDTSF